jgi:hypothetical protein
MPNDLGSALTDAAAFDAGLVALQPYCDTTNAPKVPAADTLRNSRLDCDFFMVLIINYYE